MIGGYYKFCYKIFGDLAKKSVKEKYELKRELMKSHFEPLPEMYLSFVWMNTIISAIVSVILFILFHFFIIKIFVKQAVLEVVSKIGREYIANNFFVFPWEVRQHLHPFTQGARPEIEERIALQILGKTDFLFIVYIIVVVVIWLLPLIIYALLTFAPTIKAGERRRDIDNYLPYAVNFIAAMAAANATPQMTFKSLGKQERIYGEVSREAKWIYEDMTLFGYDLISSLKRAVERSPSERFQEFLQGVIGTLTSGGNLRLYYLNRAEYYMRENRREQKDFLDALGIMAESYVVVAVAMPVFLMIILVITYWVSGGGFAMSDMMLNVIVYLMLPVLHVAYAITIYVMSPKI